jgi:transcription antitermination factor NusG
MNVKGIELEKWFVLVCKRRKEFVVKDTLYSSGFEVFCPTYIKISKWSDRLKKTKTPLITPYVFIQLKESERSIVFQYPFIKSYLFFNGNPAIVKKEEIDILKEKIDENYKNITVNKYKRGDKVIINDMSFNGRKAEIKNASDKKVYLVLENLGCHLTLDKHKVTAIK